jgi:hypothetical protein
MKTKETKMQITNAMKTILLSLLLLATGSAWAAWVKVTTTGNGENTFYLEPDSFRKNGNLRTVWQVQDYKKIRPDGTMSFRTKNEYDCKEERYRVLAASNHSENLANGRVISDFGSYESWIEIAPNTPSEVFLKIVCAN